MRHLRFISLYVNATLLKKKKTIKKKEKVLNVVL